MTATTEAAWRAATRMHHRYLTGLILYTLQKRGEEAATELVFRTFREQHHEKFLPGLKRLGLEGLPPAVAVGRYFYLANGMGGVKMELMPESETKVWIRYPPPRWIWEGAAICAVPTPVSLAFPRAFHSQCGISMGVPNLGFVCTAVTTDGEPGLEGYFKMYDRDLADDERLQFARGEPSPDFDPAAAPVIDLTPSQLVKSRRNYALQFVRTMLPIAVEMFGPDLPREAAVLIGMHHAEETAEILGKEINDINGFSDYLAAMIEGGGETVERDGPVIRMRGWRLMQDKPNVTAGVFGAWHGLWEGALMTANRRLALRVEQRADRTHDYWQWRVCGAGQQI